MREENVVNLGYSLLKLRLFRFVLGVVVLSSITVIMVGCDRKKNANAHFELEYVDITSATVITDTSTEIILDNAEVARAVSASNITVDVKQSTVTDARNGKVYKTVKIGDGPIWMTENLNLETADSWCYENDSTNCHKYGRLYTWHAAVRACVDFGNGWRLPDEADWDALINVAGGRDIAATSLKSRTDWSQTTMSRGSTIVGTDLLGFSARPGGSYSTIYGSVCGSANIADCNGYSIGSSGFWWSATTDNNGEKRSVFRVMYNDREAVYVNDNDQDRAFSVRCIREDVRQFGD